MKKRSQRGRKLADGNMDTVADRRDVHERRVADDRDAVDQAASDLLTGRQQQILRLSFEGWSVQEIAEKLDVSAARVSDEKYKAIHKLRAHLAEQM